jgi:very-short-patch-repair endonuclease
MPSDKRIHNRKELVSQRKFLRNNNTSAEGTLWLLIKGKQLDGRKFRRQHSVGYYVLDFYCPAEKLAVELDGQSHFTEDGLEHDKIRAGFISGLGIRIVRFGNAEVFENPDGVLGKIREHFK